MGNEMSSNSSKHFLFRRGRKGRGGRGNTTRRLYSFKPFNWVCEDLLDEEENDGGEDLDLDEDDEDEDENQDGSHPHPPRRRGRGGGGGGGGSRRQRRKRILPKERSGHRIVYYKGSIYSFGGYNPEVELSDADLIGDEHWIDSMPLFKELWRLNVFSRQWTKLVMRGPIPDQLASHTASVYNGKMIVYGGTGAPFGLTTSNVVHSCDLRTCQWEELEPTANESSQNEGGIGGSNKPSPLYGQAVVIHDGYLYTVGGTSGINYCMDIHKFNLRTKEWTCLFKSTGMESEPSPRYRHELCLYNNCLYVLGGGTSFEANRFVIIPSFNLETNNWEWIRTHPDPTIPIEDGILEQFPTARRCHSAIQRGKHVYIFGGYDGEEIFGDVWRLDLSDFRWTKLPFNMPSPVYFHASTASDAGKIFTFGGVCNIESNHRTNKVYSCWTNIPSLRNICWEALNHYIPNLANKAVGKLLEEGIPRDLINTLHCNKEIVG